MVFYTCSGCGESLKKNKVESHCYSCYNCEYLTCIDCNKDFYGNDYKYHTACMTENEKYSAKGTEIKPNKGDVKQQQWLQNIEIVMSSGSNFSQQAQNLIKTLSNYDNIPRKKAKFLNFLKNSLRIYDTALGGEVYEAFSSATNTKPKVENGAKNTDIDKMENQNLDKTANTTSEDQPKKDLEQTELKKAKKRKKDSEKAESSEETDSKSKKSAKRRKKDVEKSDCCDISESTKDVELKQNGGELEKAKKRKKDTEKSHCGEQNDTKSKKKRKTNTEKSDISDSPTDELKVPTEESKKRRKKQKHSHNTPSDFDAETANGAAVTQNSDDVAQNTEVEKSKKSHKRRKTDNESVKCDTSREFTSAVVTTPSTESKVKKKRKEQKTPSNPPITEDTCYTEQSPVINHSETADGLDYPSEKPKKKKRNRERNKA